MSPQAVFASALTNPAQACPPGLTSWNHSDVAQRFSVYRNNVMASLVDALADTFAVTQELVGTEFFRAMAQVFVQNHPPQTRVLTWYGQHFPDFIAGFEPAASLPYLPDVARLEMLRVRSYHAADAAPIDASSLALALADSAALAQLTLVLHPSVHVLASRYAAYALWASHQGAMALESVDPQEAESVLIYRHGLDVLLQAITPAQHCFVQQLQVGQPLAQAVDDAVVIDADFDLPAILAILIRQQLITQIE
jgi:hypothetical protein